jgi:hypothetical protein
MRFCSGDCLDAYQRRINELTMMKIQDIELSPRIEHVVVQCRRLSVC